MSTKTRYFAIVSLAVLVVGLGTGLLAYYVGLPAGEAAGPGGPEELQFVSSDAALVAYADVRDIMTSPFGERVRTAFSSTDGGRRTLATQTGINIETDIDRVIAAAIPSPDGQTLPGFGLVLARGRFDAVTIEGFVREHGGRVEEYKGKRLIVGDSPQGGRSLSLAFLETGLVALGTTDVVKAAVDLAGGGASVTANEAVMLRVRMLDPSSAWVIGRVDDPATQAALPAGVGQQLRGMQWFSASARVDAGVHGVVRAEAQDEKSAADLRDIIRGGIALARFQTAARPELEPLLRSLELGGTGRAVELAFDVPPDLLDLLDPILNAARPGIQPGR